ncbi:MAG: AAA family ATPase [Deltaproteobacteria bacterium]|nr:AAA family ATPase [Deltaproteobacteria bacterium]
MVTLSVPATGPAQHFVGRERELEALEGAFQASRQGLGGGFFVYGESGVGKSALVRRFLERLVVEHPQVPLAMGRCYERDAGSFKSVQGVIEDLQRYLSHLPDKKTARLLPRGIIHLAHIFPVLKRVPGVTERMLGQPRIESPQELRSHAFSALRDLLSRLAASHSVVIYIDDLQWVDADSLALLEEIMHPPEAPALFLVATMRTAPEAHPGAARLLTLLGSSSERVRQEYLAPLPIDQAQELASLLLRGENATTDVLSLAREGSGHPLFISELVRHAVRRGSQAAGTVKLDDALWDRIAELPGPARRLLEVIAMAGSPIAVNVAARAAGLLVDEGPQYISQLGLCHFVRSSSRPGRDDVECYHDRVRESILARLPDDHRVEHHFRLAEALEHSGAIEVDPQALVRHLEGAGQAMRAARVAEVAAKRADEALAFDQAAEFYQTALRLGPDDKAASRLLRLNLADALANAGRSAEAAEMYLAAAEGASRTGGLELRVRAAEQYLFSGHISEGLGLLDEVLAELHLKLPKTRGEVILSLLWYRTLLRIRGIRFRPRSESEVDAETLTRIDIMRSVGASMAMVDNARGAAVQAQTLLLALKLGEKRRIAMALATDANFIASQGGERNWKRAQKFIKRANEVASEVGEPYLTAFVSGCAGIQTYFHGDFPAANVVLAKAEAIFRDQTKGSFHELSTVRIFRMLALRHLGRLRELRRAVDSHVRDAMRRGDRYTATTMVRALNFSWLTQGLPEEGRRELEQKSWVPPEGGYHVQHWYELRARGELDLFTGDGATSLARWREKWDQHEKSLLHKRVQIVRSEARWLKGRLLLAEAMQTGMSSERRRQILKIAARLEVENIMYAKLYVYLLRAGVESQSKNLPRATWLLGEAIRIAEEQGMALIVAAACRRLGQLHGGDEGTQIFSRGEQWMIGEEVKDPERVTEVVATGIAITSPRALPAAPSPT